MTNVMKRCLLLLGAPILFFGGLAGCGGSSNNPPETATYRIELTNLTANQPLSPAAVILHTQGYTAWQLGQPAGHGLELLAEGGDPATLLAEATANAASRDAQAAAGAVPPGGGITVNVTGRVADARLTVASMLVNTNDGFTGIDNAHLADLAVGGSRSWDLAPYDAGTETNSETAATVPGPAAGGEGYNPLRDDRDYVAIHPGAVSADDGLTTSALDQSHRFQNPVARLVVTRMN